MTSSSANIRPKVTIDGNEAAAYVAHQTNEVIAIYPITPSSNMGEWADQWSAEQKTNIWGTVPTVVEMQSEGGAAGALHGALQAGSLGTTFTASQGLLLMIPNMFKIAGELTSSVIHVAARALADPRPFDLRRSQRRDGGPRHRVRHAVPPNSVQEAMDMALIAQAATLERACRSSISSTASAPRMKSPRWNSFERRRYARHDRRRSGAGASRARR